MVSREAERTPGGEPGRIVVDERGDRYLVGRDGELYWLPEDFSGSAD